MSKNVVKTNKREIEMPTTMITEAQQMTEQILIKKDSDGGQWAKTTYGHAAIALSQGLFGSAKTRSPEDQQKRLKELILCQIQKFGRNIIPFFKNEIKTDILEIISENEIEEALRK